ncbi:MFS transporter [Streptomyces sp. NPDC019937]|uniref:MFS transporter n=1 Tax=Streptomyces sp. NPDC019937 TaxID=3154787 RepID=UPI0033D5CBAE
MPVLDQPHVERHRGVRRWWALSALTVPVLLMSIDLTVLSMAVPSLSADLAPTATQLLWIIDVYGAFLAGLLVTMGTLGDRMGRRRLLLIGALAFGGASALAAFAWNAEVLIVARALLGVAGATLMPSTLSLIRNIFTDPAERRRAIAVWAATFAGGAGLGPVAGGLLLEHFWWGSVFLINLPVMLLLLVMGPRLLPESKDPSPGPFDLLSALVLTAAVLTLIFGIKEVGKHGWGLASLTLLCGGALLTTLFAVRQRRLTHPMIDTGLFRSLPFTVAVFANIAGVFAMTGVVYFSPQYLQIVLGLSPLEAGLWSLPLAVGAVLGALTVPAVARRLPVGRVIGLGLGTAAVGYLTLSMLGVDEAMSLTFAGGALIGAGVGMAETLTNDVIIGTAPAEKAGAAAGISETAYELGGALGTAVLGSIGTSLYRDQVLEGLPPHTPSAVTDAATQTLGSASQAAGHLPPEQAEPFRALVNGAFVDAMTQTFTIAALIVGAAALAGFLTLRRLRPTGTDHH